MGELLWYLLTALADLRRIEDGAVTQEEHKRRPKNGVEFADMEVAPDEFNGV